MALPVFKVHGIEDTLFWRWEIEDTLFWRWEIEDTLFWRWEIEDSYIILEVGD